MVIDEFTRYFWVKPKVTDKSSIIELPQRMLFQIRIFIRFVLRQR